MVAVALEPGDGRLIAGLRADGEVQILAAVELKLRKNNSREVNDLTTDAQGNGYPVPGNKKDGQSR